MDLNSVQNYSVAFITTNDTHNILKGLLKEDLEVLMYDKNPKNKNSWYSSPSVIIIDTITQKNYEQDMINILDIEEYTMIPIILIVSEAISKNKRISHLKEGAFANLKIDIPIEEAIFTVRSAIHNYIKYKDLHLKSNELNRLLSTNYLVLDSKNTLLEKIKEEIDSFQLEKEEHLKGKLSGLSDYITKSIKKEYHYELFKVHFEEVHPLFYKNLLTVNKNLTDNNLKLLAFIKMGFNNTEISFLLSISTSAVLKAIQRLKKKLHIAPEDSLREYVFNVKG